MKSKLKNKTKAGLHHLNYSHGDLVNIERAFAEGRLKVLIAGQIFRFRTALELVAAHYLIAGRLEKTESPVPTQRPRRRSLSAVGSTK
ncbi:MAG: hypothetical protein NDI61_01920 [Bdellovibrionaceae bacterium]|nr:hypothetical protein [Pseudobdellovibrionaceae bacterium]